MEDIYSDIDESKLSPMERLGLAYCRMNKWQWDEKIAPKPEGFDAMDKDAKCAILVTKMEEIRKIIGEPYMQRCWWVFELKRTEADFVAHQEREIRKLLEPDEPTPEYFNYIRQRKKREKKRKNIFDRIRDILAAH